MGKIELNRGEEGELSEKRIGKDVSCGAFGGMGLASGLRSAKIVLPPFNRSKVTNGMEKEDETARRI